MNFIALDKTDPAISEAVAGCEVGKAQTFTITVTPTSDSDSQLLGTIDSIEYSEVEEPVEESTEEAAPSKEAPYRPKARKESATALPL